MKSKKKGPTPYYSHHVKGPALRYEVGVSIFGGDIVWTNGPFRAGCTTETKTSIESLKKTIDPDEIVEQFSMLGLYSGKKPNSDMAKLVPKKTRDRQKMINDRLVSFKILQGFRHDILSHEKVFHAIVALVQLSIEKEIATFNLDLEIHNQLRDQQQQLMKSDK
jgi:hypothetical protein